MANIRKRGDTYQIRVFAGRDNTGKQIIKTKTWKPAPGMTKKQIEKELNKQAVNFEHQVETGQFLDGSITFDEFTRIWFEDYAEIKLRPKTVNEYKGLIRRISPAIGHIKLSKLQPHHLNEFYKNLREIGIRQDTKYLPCPDFKELLKQAGYTQKVLADEIGISVNTVAQCVKGENVSQATADKIKAVLKPAEFTPVERNNSKLSEKTISEYHRLISSILAKAVQWQVIPSNPCDRAEAPRAERKEAVNLDEMQAAELLSCLQDEPIKFKTAVTLTLYTGMRRGEVCGLNWSDIDFENGLININKAVTYTPETGLQEGQTKTRGSKRIISIPDSMLALLKVYKKEQLKIRFSMGDQWIVSDKVFTNDSGGLLSPDTLSAWFKHFLKRHDLLDIHYHTLRHTAATLLIAGGVDVATVSKRLGHSDKSTTLNIYTHAIKSADKAAAEKLEAMLAFSAKKAN